MWCGLLNTCPAREGDAVTVGCFVQYDWLSFLLQYRPIVSMNVSLQFLEDGSTLVRHTPDVPSPQPGPQVPPDSVLSHTTYTTTAGETWVNATCMVEFLFTRAPTAYSNRNRYSETTLRRTCTISQRVPCEYLRFQKLNPITNRPCYGNSCLLSFRLSLRLSKRHIGALGLSVSKRLNINIFNMHLCLL